MKTIEDLAAEAARAQRFSEVVTKSAERVLEAIIEEMKNSPEECHLDDVLHSYISALLMLPFQKIFKGSRQVATAGYAATYAIEQYLVRFRAEAAMNYPGIEKCIEHITSSKEYLLKGNTVELVNDFMKEKSP